MIDRPAGDQAEEEGPVEEFDLLHPLPLVQVSVVPEDRHDPECDEEIEHAHGQRAAGKPAQVGVMLERQSRRCQQSAK